MRCLRIGFGLCLGLLSGVCLLFTLGHCSFYLPERMLCADLGCSPNPDQGRPPADMTRDPNDPTVPGPYKVATLSVPNPLPNGIDDQLLLGPSDDGTTISTRETRYPVVLVAPPRGVSFLAMRLYAERLCSYGFVVGLYQVNVPTDDTGYRDAGLRYLNFVLLSTDESIKSRLDVERLGLMGYELGAKISIAMAVQDARIGALYLIDPVDLFAKSNPIPGVMAMGQVRLRSGGTVAMLGEPLSSMGAQPCVQSPQKSYADFYNAALSPALAITFQGANLGDFIENFPDAQCTAGATTPRATTQALAMKFMAAYFQWTLKGIARQREYLLGNDFALDAASASLMRQSK